MRFNIISNLSNGAGLERDYKLVRRILEEKGHSVEGVMFDQSPPYPKADVNIWLEILPSPSWGLTVAAIDAAPRNWVIPNPEWWYADLWDRHLPRFEKVICKTRDCTRIFERKAPGRCSFTGFESLDLYEPETERQPTFLHMAGKSETKNTAAVMQAWREYSLPPLTVVAYKPNIAHNCKGVPNVVHIDRLSEDQVRGMMNRHRFHIMPSKYEGFGHYIHEAIGCGGIVLTTNARPMNEFRGIARQALIEPESQAQMRSAMAFSVSPRAIAMTVREMASLPEARLDQISENARRSFLADREDFRKAFGALL
jgi:hypothetical protein